MKNLITLLIFTLIFISCDKEDNPQPTNPVDQLPPATEVGANTFGCLLDGVAFKPDNLPNSTNCFYQLVNGEYYFTLSASKYNTNLKVISLKTEKKPIFQNETYNLFEVLPNNAYGNYTLNNNQLYTNQVNTGVLTITKLTNQIVSGTFWFDVQDQNGVIHQIREGRFDMLYTN